MPREAVLTDGSYLTTAYPSDKDRRHRTGGLRVRVVEYRLEGVAGAEPLYRLVNTVLDPAQAPAAELAALYHERWEIEGPLAELKTQLRGAQVMPDRTRPPADPVTVSSSPNFYISRRNSCYQTTTNFDGSARLGRVGDVQSAGVAGALMEASWDIEAGHVPAPASPFPVPDDTAEVVRRAFPRGNPLLSLRDKLGPVFDDGHFAQLFPNKGQPAEAPWRLALVTLLQFAEDLSDRQAADAVRSRRRYLLCPPLADAGFDSTVLSEFRARLIAGAAEMLLLDAVLAIAAAQQQLKAPGRQRTDSTHVLTAARAMNRIERVHETLR